MSPATDMSALPVADALPGPVLREQVSKFPTTRLMGSKARLLGQLWQQISVFAPNSVLDMCSGSGVVSYMLKAQGCRVHANDYMAMAFVAAQALVENSRVQLSPDDVNAVAIATDEGDALVQRTYGTLYFNRDDTAFIDRARAAIRCLPEDRRSLATAALIRACLKKRPRGIFTYTGQRYDDGRKDLRLSLRDHFVQAAGVLNAAVFCNGQSNRALRCDIAVSPPQVDVDLIYLDPPYFSPLSDNEYVRRYHFVEALACDWQGVEIERQTKTLKIRKYPTPFSCEAGAMAAFNALADYYKAVPLVISYSTNALPAADAIVALLKRHRRTVRVIALDHRYSLGNHGHLADGARNRVQELIFTAY